MFLCDLQLPPFMQTTHPLTQVVLTASCFPRLCSSVAKPSRREQNLLVQVRRRIARDADVIDFFNPNSRRPQTILDRLRGKTRTMLDAIEPLFFDRGNQLTIADDRRGRITVISIYAENDHVSFWVQTNQSHRLAGTHAELQNSAAKINDKRRDDGQSCELLGAAFAD